MTQAVWAEPQSETASEGESEREREREKEVQEGSCRDMLCEERGQPTFN